MLVTAGEQQAYRSMGRGRSRHKSTRRSNGKEGLSQCQSQGDTAEQQEDKEVLNEHICKRPYSRGNPAGLHSAERLHPEFVGLSRDMFFAPAFFICGSSRGYQ